MNMNIIRLTIVALSFFTQGTTYPVELKSCDQDRIFISYEDESFEIKLFNIILQEEGKETICAQLNEAKDIKIEIDKSSSLEEPINAYVFLDEELLQEKLIMSKGAKIAIHNPEYKYAARLKNAEDALNTMSDPILEKPIQKVKPSSGYRYLIALIIIWISLFYLIFRKKLRLHSS